MILIFSDLDGTLLEFDSYSFDAAREALSEMKARGIPLILSSSKTRAEIERIRTRLANHDPFIPENGSAGFFPPELFENKPPDFLARDGYYIAEFGTPYKSIIAAFFRLKRDFNLPATGFHEMTAAEIATLTGLPLEEAELAAKREYTEPFLAEDSFNPGIIEGVLRRENLRLTRGGRFFHLSGPNDKGEAVRCVVRTYKAFITDARDPVITVALGDSPNDLEMLRAVDHAFAVRKPSGDIDPVLRKARIKATRGAGPEGWNEAVLDILRDMS